MKNQVMEKQSKFYGAIMCVLSTLTFNMVGLAYGMKVRSNVIGTFEEWADTLPCNRILYILNMVYYIVGLIIAVSFNIAMLVHPLYLYMSWIVPLYLVCITSLWCLYTTQKSLDNLYPESACLVQGVRPVDGSHKEEPTYSAQFVSTPLASSLPQIVTQPSGLKYPLIH